MDTTVGWTSLLQRVLVCDSVPKFMVLEPQPAENKLKRTSSHRSTESYFTSWGIGKRPWPMIHGRPQHFQQQFVTIWICFWHRIMERSFNVCVGANVFIC